MAGWVRKVHLGVTAVVGAQLVVWTATGFAFTLFDFAAVRGTADRAPPSAVDFARVHLTPVAAAVAASRSVTAAHAVVRSIVLQPLGGDATYVVAFAGGPDEVLVDAASGAVRRVDRDVAARIAVGAYHGAVHARDVERRRADDRDGFVVRLDDRRSTEVTVDAHTGEVTSWKNGAYRWFDALWSAHVLGYVDRTSPANWPLRVVGFLALAAATSGAGLLAQRLLSLVRGRRSAHAAVLSTDPT
jgi:uncharacterized membrane protein YkoI